MHLNLKSNRKRAEKEMSKCSKGSGRSQGHFCKLSVDHDAEEGAPTPNTVQGGETNLAKVGPGHRLVNVKAKHPGSERQSGGGNSSLILACCRGKAEEARPALFVTLLILGHQE